MPHRDARRELVPHTLLEHRRDVRVFGEVAIRARVAAAIARMNQIRQRLRSRGALVKIGALSAERVRRHHRLRAESESRRWGSEVRLAVAWSSVALSLTFLFCLTLQRTDKRKNCAMPCTRRSLLFALLPASLSFRVRTLEGPRRLPAPGRMLINLLPDFFAVLDSTDRVAAYQRYFEPTAESSSRTGTTTSSIPTVRTFGTSCARRRLPIASDLRAMLERTDVVSLARNTEQQCRELLLECDADVDVVLMVGVGAANAGELVVDGRGIAFVCLEHFTERQRIRETQGLGLDPELIPLWLAHEIAHAVRYTSPTSRSEMRRLIDDAGGYYSYWDTGRRATLRELLDQRRARRAGLARHQPRTRRVGVLRLRAPPVRRRPRARVGDRARRRRKISIAPGSVFDSAICPAA